MNSPNRARRFQISGGVIVVAWGLAAPVSGQWLNYPTPGIPRKPDGKPNLTTPRRKRRTASRIFRAFSNPIGKPTPVEVRTSTSSPI
jgi:hypothetical protein